MDLWGTPLLASYNGVAKRPKERSKLAKSYLATYLGRLGDFRQRLYQNALELCRSTLDFATLHLGYTGIIISGNRLNPVFRSTVDTAGEFDSGAILGKGGLGAAS